jgi:hypothetical protein
MAWILLDINTTSEEKAMDYQTHYNRLIDRARDRITNGNTYYEKHHIIPKCMGGADHNTNLVYLLPEEHYVAHLLLVKIHRDVAGLVYAANMMANRNNKTYGWVKRAFAQQNSIDHTGLKHSEEAKAKMRAAIKQRWEHNPEGFSEEQRRRASRPKGKKDGYFKPKTEQHSKNISEAAKSRPRVTCELCGKSVTKANLKNHMKVHQ